MHPVDWLLFALPVAFVVFVALRAQRYVHGVADFLSAGRIARRYTLCVASGEANFGLITLVGAFGVFLSAALGRPVALFTAIVFLLVSEMSPSVVEQYPDEFGATLSDRIGLMVARTVADATHPVSSLSPLERLSRDECVEPREVVRAVAINVVALPILLAILAAFILPRKQEE